MPRIVWLVSARHQWNGLAAKRVNPSLLSESGRKFVNRKLTSCGWPPWDRDRDALGQQCVDDLALTDIGIPGVATKRVSQWDSPHIIGSMGQVVGMALVSDGHATHSHLSLSSQEHYTWRELHLPEDRDSLFHVDVIDVVAVGSFGDSAMPPRSSHSGLMPLRSSSNGKQREPRTAVFTMGDRCANHILQRPRIPGCLL